MPKLFPHSPTLGHVITGGLSIITNPQLRAIFEKGPKFREPRIDSWPKNYDLIKNAVQQCQEKWASRLRVPQVVLEVWVTTVLSKVRAKIESLSRKGSACVAKSIFADREVQQSLKDLHERYMASNFRHLTGCEDGIGTFCCYGKSRRQRQIAHWPRRLNTGACHCMSRAMRTA